MYSLILIIPLLLTISVSGSDITNAVFSSLRDGMPAAFGDFNSDELTDVFILRNNSRTVQILLASDHEPLLSPGIGLTCDYPLLNISSVVPGDFDGDAIMDFIITSTKNEISEVYIIWGGVDYVNCTTTPIIKTIGEPLAIDYDQDMIIDLFGVNEKHERVFWVFNSNRTTPREVPMAKSRTSAIKNPHSHAFVDINEDFTPDLFLTTDEGFEIWYGYEEGERFVFNRTIPTLIGFENGFIGQALFLDVELTGKLDLLLPICFDIQCVNSTILVHKNDRWHNLEVNFKDSANVQWGFYPPDGEMYTRTITLRGGDFNMDGYPDLLATLTSPTKKPQSFLMENIPCVVSNCGVFDRTFAIRWDALKPFTNGTVMAVYYDFYQDGILDVILVENPSDDKNYRVVAFKNSLDYDANFVKVMVLTGLTNYKFPAIIGPLGKKKRTYGTNLPGPRITYKTTTTEGDIRKGVCTQLPQSAHFSMHLPYSIFGLGRTPNFVDTLTVGLSNRSRSWTQIIPNSQMVVIPWPPAEPGKWKAQLFVTPSKLIIMSVFALTGTCGLITLIIAILYLKERREDKIERLQESHRFHFDAM